MNSSQREAARLSEKGNALLAAGQTAQALEAQQQAAAAWPESGLVLCNLGNALQAAGRIEEAGRAFLRAARLEPRVPEIQNNLGALLLRVGRPAEAMPFLEKAVALRPGYVDALFNLGSALMDLGRTDEAEVKLRLVAPHHPGARSSLAVLANQRGNRLIAANRISEALDAYREAKNAEPGNALIDYNQGLALLVAGDLARGWIHYERRLECKIKHRRTFAAPRWDGRAPLAGKSLFLPCEQGLGDTLQFARYVPLLAQLGATLVLEAHPPLHPLLRASFPEVAAIVSKKDPVPATDYHLYLLSAPGALGTTLETIPAPVRYLRPPDDRARHWRERLPGGGALRVGLVWSGNPGHQNDHNRSMPFADLARALPQEGFRYFALQKEVRETDRAALAQFPVTPLGPELHDFGETAAAADQMDVILSVDTSVAHVAAALGRPTWILLPFAPDWRWLLERDDSPWYPTARLWRQPAPGAWASVLARVAAALESLRGQAR